MKYSHHQTKYIGVGLRTYQHPCTIRSLLCRVYLLPSVLCRLIVVVRMRVSELSEYVWDSIELCVNLVLAPLLYVWHLTL
jgi:hypothetical protein